MGACYYSCREFNSLFPTTNQDLSPLQLVLGYQLNISHLRVFGCTVYVPLAPTHRTKLGPQRCFDIYVGFQSSSIINYIEPLIGEVLLLDLKIVILMKMFSGRKANSRRMARNYMK